MWFIFLIWLGNHHQIVKVNSIVVSDQSTVIGFILYGPYDGIYISLMTDITDIWYLYLSNLIIIFVIHK